MASSSNLQTHPTPAVTTPSSASSAANSPAPRLAPHDDEPDRLALEKSLNELTHSLLELGIMVHDFQPGTHVIDKINQVTNHYMTIDKIKDNISSLYVPEEVVKYVEEARNPDIFTQSFVERAAAENQFTNGKIQAIKCQPARQWCDAWRRGASAAFVRQRHIQLRVAGQLGVDGGVTTRGD
ncbi:transcription factor subunit Med10 of mediator complex-domain-containing protein [Endogone sp. FLAS-F59071]|nr:transcription factor subunit Med10 of mediator complex-domain-containing protein [Endogone sp. FLAS-F59071]|eukprot:RUS17615.1 transcription factor subunit Med10 of mediator complex-domain-containing protein [Endogone sp. FLAS-F59071]